ncbi:F-box/FBD/LRR-repeat protein At1g13570 [Linum perenne]
MIACIIVSHKQSRNVPVCLCGLFAVSGMCFFVRSSRDQEELSSNAGNLEDDGRAASLRGRERVSIDELNLKVWSLIDRGSSKSAKKNASDGICSLPDSIIEHILSFLPLKEAVRTSVLSKSWNHKWVNRPALVFDDDFLTPFPVVETASQFYHSHLADVVNATHRLVSNVFKVLCFHRGPLKEFSLSNSLLRGYPAEVDQILLFLEGKSIESLGIKIEGYKIPSRLFSFTKLKKLYLTGCVFTSLHVSFEEFRMLTCLELRSIKFQADGPAFLVVKSSLLKFLTLIDCGSSSNNVAISIEVPSLTLFLFFGSFSSLRVSEAPLLRVLSLVDHPNSTEEPTDFIKLLDGCPELLRLTTPIYLIRSKMTAEQTSGRSPRMIIKNYEELKQKANRVQIVTIKLLTGTKCEMGFIRWLLATSPELDKMKIEFSKSLVSTDQIQCYKELNGFQRASSKAQIII